MDISKDMLMDFYRSMVTIRNFELKAAELFAGGRIPGFVHLYAGQEAIATGVCANLTPEDKIASTHRGHGHVIAKGGNLKLMMAELFAKTTGYCKGKGGSMHIADVSIGILGANGIVGASLPIATGAGFACKYKGEQAVSVCFFGDGAANRGTFHESVNLASIWKLPVIYVLENNLYAVGSDQRKAMAIRDISIRAAGYGIPGVDVDGNDVTAVYKASSELIARARKGEGPGLLVANSWRHRGHFEGEPEIYRNKEEIKEWLKKDPIPRLASLILDRGFATEDTLASIESEVKIEIDETIKFAEESPDPKPEEVLDDVFETMEANKS